MHALIFSFNPPSMSGRNSGAHRIATHLRSHGWDIEVIDFADMWSFEELKEVARQRVTPKTKFFGISQFGYNDYGSSPDGVQFMSWVKQTYPDIKIILGAQLIDRAYPHVDYVVSGYAEVSIMVLLKYLFGNSIVPPIMREFRGIKYIDSQNDYIAHPWNDCSIYYQDNDYIMPNEWGVTEFSRGCKFACKFCTSTILGVKSKTIRDVENVEKELLYNYNKYGITNYFITDPTFNTESDKITAYADLVERLPFTPYFSGFIRPDLLVKRKQDREELLRMNFLGHFYGVETFNEKASKYIGKGNPEMVKNGLIEVKDFFMSRNNKYRGLVNLIAGLPYEDKQSLESTIEWVKQNWKGQSARMNALMIQSEDHPFPSQLSMEYAKLGYRQSAKTIEDMHTDELVQIFKGLTRVADNGECMQWENDNMDIYEAGLISNRLNGTAKLRTGLNAMKLHPESLHQIYCDDQGIPLSLERRLGLVVDLTTKFTDNFKRVFVKNYIHKKLS